MHSYMAGEWKLDTVDRVEEENDDYCQRRGGQPVQPLALHSEEESESYCE